MLPSASGKTRNGNCRRRCARFGRVDSQQFSPDFAGGTDLTMGARPLRQAIERDLVDPLSRLIASQQVKAGDVVEVELSGNQLAFYLGDREPGVIGLAFGTS